MMATDHTTTNTTEQGPQAQASMEGIWGWPEFIGYVLTRRAGALSVNAVIGRSFATGHFKGFLIGH